MESAADIAERINHRARDLCRETPPALIDRVRDAIDEIESSAGDISNVSLCLDLSILIAAAGTVLAGRASVAEDEYFRVSPTGPDADPDQGDS